MPPPSGYNVEVTSLATDGRTSRDYSRVNGLPGSYGPKQSFNAADRKSASGTQRPRSPNENLKSPPNPFPDNFRLADHTDIAQYKRVCRYLSDGRLGARAIASARRVRMGAASLTPRMHNAKWLVKI